MAKFESAIGEISGRLGGLVFSKNAAGNYVKTFVRQNNPKTTLQTAKRTQLADIDRAWAVLTEDQRVAWRAQSTTIYDVFGNERTLAGRQLYIALCRNMQLIGYPLFTDPPANFNPPVFPDEVLTMKQSEIPAPPWDDCFEIELHYDVYDEENTEWVFRATRPLRNTVQNPGAQQRFIRHVTAEQPTDTYLHSQYYTRFGTYTRATYEDAFSIHWWIQLMNRTNGIITSPIIVKCIFGDDTVVYTP